MARSRDQGDERKQGDEGRSAVASLMQEPNAEARNDAKEGEGQDAPDQYVIEHPHSRLRVNRGVVECDEEQTQPETDRAYHRPDKSADG